MNTWERLTFVDTSLMEADRDTLTEVAIGVTSGGYMLSADFSKDLLQSAICRIKIEP